MIVKCENEITGFPPSLFLHSLLQLVAVGNRADCSLLLAPSSFPGAGLGVFVCNQTYEPGFKYQEDKNGDLPRKEDFAQVDSLMMVYEALKNQLHEDLPTIEKISHDL